MKSEFIDALIVARDMAKVKSGQTPLFDWLPHTGVDVLLPSFILYSYHKFCIKSISYLFKGRKLRQSMRQPLNS